MSNPNAESVAAIFGCTVEQARAQYARCAESLRSEAVKARARGGKLRGFSAEWYEERAAAFDAASK